MGNIFGRRPAAPGGEARPPVVMGSHVDSVPTGGRFDGALGVVCAIEAVRALDDARVRTQHPVEVAVFTNEEGARFQPAMLGSAVLAGKLSLEDAYQARDRHGIRLVDELERIGYLGAEPCVIRPVRAYLELHIEQGPRLEEAGESVGVVEGIVAISWTRVTFHGDQDHAARRRCGRAGTPWWRQPRWSARCAGSPSSWATSWWDGGVARRPSQHRERDPRQGRPHGGSPCPERRPARPRRGRARRRRARGGGRRGRAPGDRAPHAGAAHPVRPGGGGRRRGGREVLGTRHRRMRRERGTTRSTWPASADGHGVRPVRRRQESLRGGGDPLRRRRAGRQRLLPRPLRLAGSA